MLIFWKRTDRRNRMWKANVDCFGKGRMGEIECVKVEKVRLEAG